MTLPAGDRVIVTLTGKQSPGALSDVMRVLGVDNSIHLQDFNQLVVRDRFISNALISSPGAQDRIKDILFRAHETGINVHFTVPPTAPNPQSSNSLQSLSQNGADEYVLTLFAPHTVPPRFLAGVLRVVADSGCVLISVNRLTEDGDPYMCLELRVSIAQDVELQVLQSRLFELGRQGNDCDLALQRANVLRRAKRMVVFDLSWTLVQCDTVDAVLRAAQVCVDKDVESAFREGRISGPEWLKERVKLLGGMDAVTVYKEAASSLVYTNGAVELCKGLKRLGCKLAVVSSGCKMIADRVKEKLGLDYSFGNEFEVDTSNKFTGLVRDPVIDAERKRELVHMLAMQERIDMEQVIVVGDGPVSAKMLSSAGMSIAFDQPDATDDVRSGRIASKSLTSVLYLLGVSGDDFKRVTEGGFT